jgi:hypothetical protein
LSLKSRVSGSQHLLLRQVVGRSDPAHPHRVDRLAFVAAALQNPAGNDQARLGSIYKTQFRPDKFLSEYYRKNFIQKFYSFTVKDTMLGFNGSKTNKIKY